MARSACIRLVVPPFTTARLPSLALAQLKTRLRQVLGDRVDVALSYLHHDVARFFGVDDYETISNVAEVYHAGFGDWLFRAMAFPDAPDHTAEFLRFAQRLPARIRGAVERMIARRAELEPLVGDLIARHGLDRAGLVGFSSQFAQTVASVALARKIKAANPDALVVIGGASCEGTMGRALAENVAVFDYVFSGPALVSFPELVERWLDGALAGPPIRGVLAASRATRRRLATVDERGAELGDELSIDEPLPIDYDDFLASFEANIAEGKRKPALLFETSRGCWWGEIQHCTFCGLNGSTMQHREMSPERALAQFRSLFAAYPDVTFFEAVDNILPHRYYATVLPFLEPPPKATIYYELKSNVDEAEAELLARSHIRAFEPGIEALNTSTLKLMKKGVTAFQNLRLLMHCMSYGLLPKWNLLIGFPGEPESVYEGYLRDFPLFTHLMPPTGVLRLRFDRFSPYHTLAREYGLELRPLGYYKLVYPFDDDVLNDLAYHFAPKDPLPYVSIARWAQQLAPAIETWRRRWRGEDGLPAASLHIVRDARGTRIHDSRSGRVVEHELDGTAERVLGALTTPKTAEALATELRAVATCDAERELARLQERGLVFVEGGRSMSLVLRGQPPAVDWGEPGDVWSHGITSHFVGRSVSRER